MAAGFVAYSSTEPAKVYEINSLACPRCGSEMTIIALITDPA
jgi:hypothetical protein